MNKFVGCVIVLFLFGWNVMGQSLPVQIEMTIKNRDVSGKVYLELINNRGYGQKIDSVTISASPFLFNVVIPEPGIYQLSIAGDQQIGLLLDGGEHLVIQADGANTDEKAAGTRIQGSEKMAIYSELQNEQFGFTNMVNDIDSKFKSTSNEVTRVKLRDEYLELLKKHNEGILEKVKSLGTSTAGILAANNFLNEEISADYFDSLAAQLQKDDNKSQLALMFIQRVNKGKMGKPGIEAPDFELQTIEGKKVKLSDLRGKIVIVDFWATWCGPCIMSFPGMKKAMDKYKDRDDVAFVYVNTFERVSAETRIDHVKKFVNNRGFGYLNTILDNNNETAFMYGVESIPTKFFIGKDGKFLHMSRGFAGSDDAVVEEITKWLN